MDIRWFRCATIFFMTLCRKKIYTLFIHVARYGSHEKWYKYRDHNGLYLHISTSGSILPFGTRSPLVVNWTNKTLDTCLKTDLGNIQPKVAIIIKDVLFLDLKVILLWIPKRRAWTKRCLFKSHSWVTVALNEAHSTHHQF